MAKLPPARSSSHASLLPARAEGRWVPLGLGVLPAWTRWGLILLAFVALAADFLANDKPLYCKVEGESYSPVLRAYGVKLGLAEWPEVLPDRDWRDKGYEQVVWAPVPWSPTGIDRRYLEAVSPLARQSALSWRERHWLGTDTSGRDVAAGMVHGTRLALLVGLGSMALAGLIGIILGAMAGYFGDGGLRLRLGAILALLGGLTLLAYYLWGLPEQTARRLGWGWPLLLAAVLTLTAVVGWGLGRLPFLRRRVALPVDFLVLRIIEVLNALPALLILLALLAMLQRPNLGYLILIIGGLSWTGVARFARSELLRIRTLPFVESARAMGFSEGYILRRHALPNALQPVFITLAFGLGNAILLEAYLSFLGIGLPVEQVSWGGLLSQAKSQYSAWWLAVFPGAGIFLTVLSFNVWGERLADRDPT